MNTASDKIDIKVYEYQPRTKYPTCLIRPAWLDNLKTGGATLSLSAIWRQAGRHFGDRLIPIVVGYNGTARQLATDTAWRLASMLRPSIDLHSQLVLVPPNDADVQRLAIEILGVGASLELLVQSKAIDRRTIRKLSGRFDYEAHAPNAGAKIFIEAKGTLNGISRQKHRASIQKKINHPDKKPRKKRTYDRWLGVIFLGWSQGKHPGIDFEIADPTGEPSGNHIDALAAIAEFYARTFELVGLEGAQRFWQFSQNPTMSMQRRKELFFTHSSITPFSRVSVKTRFPDGSEIEFGGSYWRSWSVVFLRENHEPPDRLLDYCFIGVDKRIIQDMLSDDIYKLLERSWPDLQGEFSMQISGAVVVPKGSQERRFYGRFHLSGDGLIYIWSNIIPDDYQIVFETIDQI